MSKTINQDKLFLDSEGDEWFKRNQEWLTPESDDSSRLISLLERYGVQPKNILEIGASNGFRLEGFRRKFASKCVAIEPSTAAIEDGRKRFPDITFRQGLAHDIPIDDTFDLILVHFVLHWVSRDVLLRAVAEIDRLLCDEGLLLIGDFYPNSPTKSRYHHLPDEEVFTFKQDYGTLFTSSGLFNLVALETGSHERQQADANVSERDREALWLLRKTLKGNYKES